MLFKFPLLVPKGTRLTVTQPFGKTSLNLEPEGPRGEQHFHYGVDVVRDSVIQTFGTPIVCPFPRAKIVAYQFDQPMGDTTNFIKIEYVAPDGVSHKMVAAHISEIVFRGNYVEGDVIAYVGNAGLVQPKPTPTNPWGGAHSHLGAQLNGQWVDPLTIFNLNDPFIGGGDDLNKDLPAVRWAIGELTKLLTALQSKYKKN